MIYTIFVLFLTVLGELQEAYSFKSKITCRLLFGVLFAALVSVENGGYSWKLVHRHALRLAGEHSLQRELHHVSRKQSILGAISGLGKVEAQAIMKNFVLLVGIGYTSLVTLKTKALEKRILVADDCNIPFLYKKRWCCKTL